jgi:hypothetical protein
MGFDRAGPRSRDGCERQPDGRSARRPLAPGGAGRLRPLRQDGDRGGSGHPGRLCRDGEAQPCLWRAARQIPEQAWKPDKAMDAEVARRPCVPRGWPKGTPASPGGSRSPGRTCAVTSGLDGAGPSTRTSCASWTEARPTSPQLLRVAPGARRDRRRTKKTGPRPSLPPGTDRRARRVLSDARSRRAGRPRAP